MRDQPSPMTTGSLTVGGLRPRLEAPFALRVSLLYAVVGAIWILASDRLVSLFLPDVQGITYFQTFKGIAFVTVTAFFLYWVLHRVERRRQREAARRVSSEDLLRKLSVAVEQSPVSVVITARNGSIEYVNPKFTASTGYAPDEVVGKNPRLLKSGELPPETYQQLWQTITQGGTWEGEFHNRKKNGELFWELASISPIYDEQGRITHFLAVKEEITERKRIEAALRESEENFRLLFENASDLVTVVDGSGMIQSQSPSSLRLMGYAPTELEGRSAFEFIHADDTPSVLAALQRALASPGEIVPVEFRFRHQNGAWRTLEALGRSVPGKSATGFLVVNSRDVTEHRTLAEQARQSQKMESIGQLAGGVAHDFNNILAVMQMQAGLLAAKAEATPAIKDGLDVIVKSADRAANLTRQLLLFSRRQPLQPRNLDLTEVVTQFTKMLKRILGETVQMHLKFAPQPLIVHADAGMLEQVLMNLAVNARDAMPKGGQLIIETICVQFDARTAGQSPQARVGEFACLAVSDTGTGISPEIQARIFEPFFTTKETGKGTGLGLATVFGIVQQHEGWVDVYSEVGRGTVFRVYLPRLAGDELAAAELPSREIPQGRNETILLVEDEASLRSLEAGILAQLGYRVLEAPDAAIAMRLWQKHADEVELLFTDLVLPGAVNGKELAVELLQRKPTLKVIYASGYSVEVAGRDLPLEEGVNFVSKPFDLDQLAHVIRQRLDGG